MHIVHFPKILEMLLNSQICSHIFDIHTGKDTSKTQNQQFSLLCRGRPLCPFCLILFFIIIYLFILNCMHFYVHFHNIDSSHCHRGKYFDMIDASVTQYKAQFLSSHKMCCLNVLPTRAAKTAWIFLTLACYFFMWLESKYMTSTLTLRIQRQTYNLYDIFRIFRCSIQA